jgi:hypothetical protein
MIIGQKIHKKMHKCIIDLRACLRSATLLKPDEAEHYATLAWSR